jgi:hypothetical protein
MSVRGSSGSVSGAGTQHLLREALIRKTKKSLTTFKKLMRSDYIESASGHLVVLDQTLEGVEQYVATGGEEGVGRLLVEMPPRHTKTMSISEMWPAWFLGLHPDKWVMQTSYGSTMAERSSRRARELVNTQTFFDVFGVRLSKHSKSVESWGIEGRTGGYEAAGIRGGVMGKGADALIVDDPYRSRHEADNPLIREDVWTRYSVDLQSRLEPGAVVIIVHTRWHWDDLIGRCKTREGLVEDGGIWHSLRFPAIAEEDDSLGREEGEALFPERFSVAYLEALRDRIGIYGFEALYQQNPHPRKGGLFKWEHIEDHRVVAADVPELDRIVIGVDPQGTQAIRTSETGICAVGIAGRGREAQLYVLGDYSGDYSSVAWARRAAASYRLWDADRIVAEKNNGGDLVESNLETHGYNLPYRGVWATRGKIVRAEPLAGMYEKGRVHHVGRLPFLENQLLRVKPGMSVKDSPDRVDALVWAAWELVLGPLGTVEGSENPFY